MPPRTDNIEPAADIGRPKTPEEIAALKEARLDYLEDIFLHLGDRFSPTGGALLKLTPREENELFEGRPHLRPTAKQAAPEPQPEANDVEQLRRVMYDKSGKLKNVRNLDMLSKRLRLHFEGRNRLGITPTHLSDWSRNPDKRHGAPEPPKPDRNEHKTQAWAEWYEKWMLPRYPVENGAQGSDGLFEPSMRVRKEAAETKRAELALLREERSVSEQWMETDVVLPFVGSFAHWIGVQQDKFVEDKQGLRRLVQETLLALNPALPPEFVTAFDTQLAGKLAEANSAMKTATAQYAKQVISDMVEKRKKDMAALETK